jgi:hypothetical protein
LEGVNTIGIPHYKQMDKKDFMEYLKAMEVSLALYK